MYKWDSWAWRHGILLGSMHENRRPDRSTRLTRTVGWHDTICRPVANCIRWLGRRPGPRHVLSHWMRLLNRNRRHLWWPKLGELSVVGNSRSIQRLNGIGASIKSKTRIKSLHVPEMVSQQWVNL
jgi:hypothetical protein